jgi:hypothetical protein
MFPVFEVGKITSKEYDNAEKESSQRAEQIAWRLAIETWLRDHGLIVVTQPQNVLLPGIIENIHTILLGHTL